MKKLIIGNKELKSNVILAPMAGITDSVLRCIVREFSPDCLVMSEMVSSEALRMNPDRSITFFNPSEKPLCYQLSGHKPHFMAEAAKMLEADATTIDINMGCPAPKIVKNGDGSALIKDPKLASEIISAVKNAVSVPVTVKTRLGWDVPSMKYLEFAKMVEDSGADAIMVHGRTRSQMYSGQADWEAIAQIKQVLKIPVIANGDINSVESARECLRITNCDGIAIGRGILGDVELISRIEHYFETGEILPEPTIQRRVEMAKLHLEKEIEYRGEDRGIRYMRKFFAYYVRGVTGASKYRFALVQMEKHQEIIDFLDEIVRLSTLSAVV
ncbi:MAG: tRNA dihydrouridine synthase DusB [Candidatus Gastranaerophilales bacterium]|nr:tRNA dihydrouridine synthase DusB [Candidatus Gastranaerophilales bacterium]